MRRTETGTEAWCPVPDNRGIHAAVRGLARGRWARGARGAGARPVKFRVIPGLLAATSILAVLAAFTVGVPLLDLVELKTYDMRVRSGGGRPPSPAVAMAVIDEKSLDTEGRWPWPRARIAALIDALSRDGARVIAFDIAFAEPDENSHVALLDEVSRQVGALAIEDANLKRFIDARRRRADNDRVLADSIRASSAAVVLGYFFHFSDATVGYRIEAREIERRLRSLAPAKYPLTLYRTADASAVPFIRPYAPETNLDMLAEVAAGAGYFTLQSDPDGVLRWMPLVIQAGDELFPPLAVVSAWHYLGRPPLTVRVGPHGVEGIQMGDRVIPTDESGQLLVNYLGPPRTFPHVSVTDILRGRLAPGTFKDRVVLVGATAVGTHDLRSTPFSPVYPGAEVQATVIDNILTARFIARPRWSRIYDLIAVIVLGAIVGIVLPRLGPVKGLAFTVGLSTLYVVAARWCFVELRLWLNLVYPMAAIGGTYTALTVYHYLTEQRERKRIKSTFRQYVAPLVVEELLKHPQAVTLGGTEKVLTVLFTDLEGFTTYSERYTATEMVQILGEYYDRITEQVFIERGTLSDYVADELIAFFGAPLDNPAHAQRACAAALAMREQTVLLAAEWQKIGRPRLRARTGINTGPMLVGNLGSRYRFAYSVLGDQVNLASRLEGLNKVYKTDILIGENTARAVEGQFLLREVDRVRVKGKTQAVGMYELLARGTAPMSLEQEKGLRSYAMGLEAYRQRAWDESMVLFEETRSLLPGDGPAAEMLERCRTYRVTPPPEDWDGSFDQKFK